MREHLNSALLGAERSAIRRYSALAKETPGCRALTLGEPDLDTPEPVRRAAQEALERGETHYVENNGARSLREAISAFERERHGLSYAPDEVVVTAGATEALFAALFGVLEPGDEVVIPTPAYPLYEQVARLCRAVPVALDTSRSAFQITAEALESAITERTKVLVVNTPNNPTGVVYTQETLAAVASVLRGRPVFALCDDVYRELSYDGPCHSLAEFDELRPQLIVAQSFSKPYAMTGWRMGYLLADAPVAERLALVHQFAVSCTPAPFQSACEEALAFDPAGLVEAYRRRRAYVLGRLEAMGLPVTVPQGAFYAFPSIAEFGLDSDAFCRALIEREGLALTPGSCFGAECFVRVSYCYGDDELRECLDRLERFVRGLRSRS